MKQSNAFLLAALLFISFAFTASAASDLDETVKTFRETLSALVKADTTNPPGNEARAVAILAERLKKEKIPYEIVDFAPGRQDLVARLKGSGEKKPLLLLAHIDVVGTKNQNWSTPPHELTEKDGYLMGRGVIDDLDPQSSILRPLSLSNDP
jgi:acetylornithine deacetylase/succinyl-diaminopimelate desuccinylase-like protein